MTKNNKKTDEKKEDTPQAEEKQEDPDQKETNAEREQAQKKIEELTDTLKRVAAEFENYKKRQDKENEAQKELANAKLIEKILPIIDTFEIAIKNSKDPEQFRKGVELIYAELATLLKNEGLEKIEANGKQFDPYLHDAMMAVESDKEKDTVLEVLQNGYKLKGRVLRHAKVKIAK